MEIGWYVTTVVVAYTGASIISPPRESPRLRDHLVRFGLPYTVLYVIGVLIGHWAGIF